MSYRALALQLHSGFDMALPCDGLMGASPDRPRDDLGRLDLSLGHLVRDAANFLYRPADQ
jgi:hypothetical protein